MQDLLTIKEASIWASKYTNKDVTSANIAYLIQYGRIKKDLVGGSVFVNRNELKDYYNQYHKNQQKLWHNNLDNKLNWQLSFKQYKESETTKHVHRLHPYKGKFIPQLVEYFLDSKVDNLKQQCFFNAGDIVLDPFCGSGTTLVQANELSLHAIGIDISEFNTFISNTKITKYDIDDIKKNAKHITNSLINFQKTNNNIVFEQQLLARLKEFNSKFFPTANFRYKVSQNLINESLYSKQKSAEFSKIYQKLIKQYQINLTKENNTSFLDKWFLIVVKNEIDFVFKHIKNIKDNSTKKILALILSRTIRSCRATTHSDLATLKEPITTTYYCKKHSKICKPVFSIKNHWQRYVKDTIRRLIEFNNIRSNTSQQCLVGDSRTININQALTKYNHLLKNKKISGIFSSPPYVGLIDYHQQHAYAYDLFGFRRRDKLEIGPLYRGQGMQARNSYIKNIAKVLNNCKAYLQQDYNILLVANDKYNLYPSIAKLANMDIVNRYERPVLNRVEKGRGAYTETIFHLKDAKNAIIK